VNGIHEVAGSIPASSTKPHFVRTGGQLGHTKPYQFNRRIDFRRFGTESIILNPSPIPSMRLPPAC
jgi:hypothetical protein